MSPRLQQLINLFHLSFSISTVTLLALKTKFKMRTGKLTPNMFIALCVLNGKDLCQSSLVKLSTRLQIKEGIEISPQALDQRFNKHAVDFLRETFEDLLQAHNEAIDDELLSDNMLFPKIKTVDSTIIQLPENLATTYRGAGGDSSKASIKIQLEYEVLSGKFIVSQINEGVSSDSSYLPFSEERLEPGELHLKDLGYFKIAHLKKIDQAEAFYISKIKRTASIYKKNPKPQFKSDGTVYKFTEYKKVDIQSIAQPLAEGQSVEDLDTYMGIDKLKSRLIVTKLTQECKESRIRKNKREIRRRNKPKNELNNLWNSVNVYITNIPPSMATADQIHQLYTLRWQIENMFKVWKSVFKLAAVKKVKRERFECFLYGRLIELVLAASIVSTSKAIALLEGIKPLSEMKAFTIASEYLESFSPHSTSHDATYLLALFLTKIIRRIIKYGVKNSKKGSISFSDILGFLDCNLPIEMVTIR